MLLETSKTTFNTDQPLGKTGLGKTGLGKTRGKKIGFETGFEPGVLKLVRVV